ncbi:hypothetical protein Pmani_036089 [Petrolisthes manimaculis]|uniref:Uncharacterized protein n=1 Tax=Petrolisthes manimaculis TaxID=1843537 RepID=A0AAE1NJG3_9EUCA|nr:hypothetical protein Pmani_036222 [Petrolisthes manimaculis]KAK4291058.1 hypothetical protein Pmani_036089 [Petrolisthes manimaculis]
MYTVGGLTSQAALSQQDQAGDVTGIQHRAWRFAGACPTLVVAGGGPWEADEAEDEQGMGRKTSREWEGGERKTSRGLEGGGREGGGRRAGAWREGPGGRPRMEGAGGHGVVGVLA